MAARTAVRMASVHARRILAAARRRTPRWQALGVLACCSVLLAGVEQDSLRWPSGPGVFLVTRNGRTVRAAQSRSGTTAWSRTLPQGCSLSPPAPYSSGGDQDLAVF